MKLSLERKIYLGFALALLILIIIVTASAWSLHQLAQASKIEEVSLQPVVLIISLSSLMAAIVVVMTIVVINADISKRRRFEEALQASETRFRTLTTHAPVGIFETDAQGECVFVNQRWCDLVRMTSAEALGQGWTQAFHPDDRERVLARWASAVHSDREFALEYRLQTPTGDIIWVFGNAMALGNEAGEIVGYLGTVTDITESKKVGEILAQRAAQLVLINDISSKIAAVLDLDSLLDRAARLVQTTFGYHHVALFLLDHKVARLKAIAGSYAEYFPTHHTQKLDQGIIGWVATHGEKLVANDVSQEPRYISKIADKTVTRAELCLPIQVAGQTVGVLDIQSPRLNAFDLNDIILTDILVAQIAVAIENARLYQAIQLELVERRQAEAALAQERNLLRTLIDHIPDYIYIKDTESRFLINNKAHSRLLGYEHPEEVQGKTDFDVFSSKFAAKAYSDEQELIRSGQSLINLEETITDHRGQTLYVLTTKVPLCDNNGAITGFVGMSRDITERKQMEEALAKERNLLRAFVDHMPDHIYVKDTQSRFIMANRAVAEVMGASSPAELIGKKDFDFYPEAMATKFYNDEQAIIRSGYPMVNYEEQILDRSLNEERWTSSTKVPFQDSEGNIIGLVGMSRDITKNKQILERLRESEERTRLIIENALDAVVTINAEGIITQWNPQAENIFGWTNQEILGQRLSTLIVLLEDRLAHEEGLKRFFVTGEGPMLNKRIEMSALHRNGHIIPVEVSITPARSEGGLIFSAFIRDITRRKQVEAAMQQARDAAEAAAQAKSAFLANMSHEIRTPLNAIIGMTSLLLDTHLSPEQREFAETVRLSSDTLLTIINDVLDFSKIEAGKLELEVQPFDLRQSIEQSLDLVAVKAAEKKLELAYLIDEKTPGAIVGDMVRLRQILVNLLSNAVKFTDAGEVIVSVTSRPLSVVDGQLPVELHPIPNYEQPARAEGPPWADSGPQTKDQFYEFHFAIRDTGLGISQERVDRLFKAFSQVDASTTRKYGGTGLGLAISNRLCQLMGGKMWVESAGIPGQGSTFHFTFRAAAAPSQPRIYLRGQHSELIGKRLLIIDDNATNRLVLRRQAQTWGMSAIAVPSGVEALELLRLNHTFDLVILDMQMPEMDGLTLAVEIRHWEEERARREGEAMARGEMTRGEEETMTREATPLSASSPPHPSPLPLVMLTSLGRGEVGNLANEVQFAAVLNKPIKSSQLYDALVGIFINKQPIKVKPDTDQPSPFDLQLGQRHPLRILLAEDNIVNQKVALRFLNRLGYQVDVVANGLEVIAALERQAYDVILMDVQMPEMDGLEATRFICQKWPETQRPRIIAMTANVLQGDRELCLEAGMNDYIGKPIRIEELIRALSESHPQFDQAEEKSISPQSEKEASGLAPALDRAALDKLRDILGAQSIPAIAELINLFIANGLNLLEKMRTAAQAGELTELYRGAHTLKPGCAHLGAMRLAALCNELEGLGKSNQFQAAVAKLAELEAEFDRVKLALETERGK